ncbi:unnamed protein product [Trichobilharzia szidati]|nr:unnamed protein product [Trichobilharzia szidati]
MKFSVVFICILQLILVTSQDTSITGNENNDVVQFGRGVIVIAPDVTTMVEITAETTTMVKTTPETTTIGETTPETTIMSGTTSEGATETTVIASTMDTSTSTQKPDDSKDNSGLGAGVIVGIVFGSLAGLAVIGAIIYFVRRWILSR